MASTLIIRGVGEIHTSDEYARVCRSLAEEQVVDTHSYAECRDEGGEAVSDDCCTANNPSEPGLVGFNEAGRDASDVGGGADEEEDDDDHAVETEEGTLSNPINTITWPGHNINTPTHPSHFGSMHIISDHSSRE